MFGLRVCRASLQEAGVSVQSIGQKRMFVAVLFAPILLFTSAGCAQKQPAPVATLKMHSGAPHDPRAPERIYAEVEMEDDGREAQQPPLHREHQAIEDDPSEPYSPNYGRRSAPAQTAQTSDQVAPDRAPIGELPAPTDVSFQASMLR